MLRVARAGVIKIASVISRQASHCAMPTDSPSTTQPITNMVGSSTLPATAERAAPMRGAKVT